MTYYGQSRLYHNRGGAGFEDVTARAGLTETRLRWGTGCAFLDFDRDGRLDLFVANYIDLDLKTAPVPESGLCRYRGIQVACGPPGLVGGKNALYRNRGDCDLRGRLRGGGHHEGEGDLRPRRQHARLRRGRLDRPLRRQRLEPQHALPEQGRRGLRGHRDRGGLRLQHGRQEPGGHGRRGGGLRQERHAGHLQDQLRRRHLDALRQHRRRPVRGPHLRERRRDQHALAGLGRGLPGPRQRRLARRVPGERPRLPRGVADPRRSQLQAAQGRLLEPRGPEARRRERAAGPADRDARGGSRSGLRRLRQRRQRRRAGEQRQRPARPLPPRVEGRPPLAHAEARGHPLEPQRDRGARALPGPGRAAGGRGARRRQLHLAERPARPLRARRDDARRRACWCAGRAASSSAGATSPPTRS